MYKQCTGTLAINFKNIYIKGKNQLHNRTGSKQQSDKMLDLSSLTIYCKT